MNYTVNIDADFASVMRMLNSLSSMSTKRLFQVGTYAVRDRIRKHLRSESGRRHTTARKLGAKPTGHIEKGVWDVRATAHDNGGVVTIPIAGISRAFEDITMSTPTRYGKRFLTIPKHPLAYGRTVGEMRRLGWKIFRPGKNKVLLGYRSKKDKPTLLFTLAGTVHLKKDPSLLPTLDECAKTATSAMMETIARTIEKGGRA